MVVEGGKAALGGAVVLVVVGTNWEMAVVEAELEVMEVFYLELEVAEVEAVVEVG